MAAVFKRFVFSLIACISILPAVAAKAVPEQQKVIENALATTLSYLCPSGNVLSCPTLDFISAFGLVFFTFWLGLNMVPQFKGTDIWGSGSAQNVALAGISVFAAMATAFYVWSMKIPFIAFIAPYGLLVVGLVLALALASVIFAVRENTSAGLKIAMAGIVLLFMSIFMSFVNPDNTGIWSLLGVFGFLLMLFGIIFMFAGGTAHLNWPPWGAATPRPPLPAAPQRVGGAPPAPPGVPPRPAPPGPVPPVPPVVGRDLIAALKELLGVLEKVKLGEKRLADLYKKLIKVGTQTGAGFDDYKKVEAFKLQFIVEVRAILSALSGGYVELVGAVKLIGHALPAAPPQIQSDLRLAYKEAYLIGSDLNRAINEFRQIDIALRAAQKTYKQDLTILKHVSQTIKGKIYSEEQGLPSILLLLPRLRQRLRRILRNQP